MDADRSRRRTVLVAAITLSDNLLRTICDDNSSESSDSDFDDPEFRRRIQLRGPRTKPSRIQGYVEVTVPRMIDDQFRSHFRMTRTTYDLLERELGPALSETDGKPTIPVRKQLLSALWLLATPDSYRSVGEKFDLGKSSLSNSFMRVVTALNDVADRFIVWPKNANLHAVKEDFSRKSRLHGIIGAIDGTQIHIKAPKKDAHCYRTYKKIYAITLQAVCDAKMRFTDCFAGFAGSVGDLRVLRNSDLWMEVHRNKEAYFPENEFIIGDKAYPVLSWLIPPFHDRGQLTEIQKKFNKVLSGQRSVIERAFALLKGRFRRLKFLDMNRDDMIPFTILACTVLHNICLHYPDGVEDFIEEGREARANEVVDGGIPDENDGLIKRQYLCTLV